MKKLILLFFITINCFAQEELPEIFEHTIFLNGYSFPFRNFYSTTLQIDLIPGNDEITRPFIVAEGFDPGTIIEHNTKLNHTNLIYFYNETATLAF